MREFTLQVFDHNLAGAGPWYTSSRFNDLLGLADGMTIHALPVSVSGTSPTFTCQIEHSANGLDWLAAPATPPINAQPLVADSVLQGVLPYFLPPLLTFVRLKFSQGGTSPVCRMRVTVTGRVSAISPAADDGLILQI